MEKETKQFVNEIIKKHDLKYKSGNALSREEKYRFKRQYFQWAMYQKGYTYEEIGALFGQDHCTAMNSCQVVDDRMETNDLKFISITSGISHDMAKVKPKPLVPQGKTVKPFMIDLKERINNVKDMEDVEALKAYINKFK